MCNVKSIIVKFHVQQLYMFIIHYLTEIVWSRLDRLHSYLTEIFWSRLDRLHSAFLSRVFIFFIVFSARVFFCSTFSFTVFLTWSALSESRLTRPLKIASRLASARDKSCLFSLVDCTALHLNTLICIEAIQTSGIWTLIFIYCHSCIWNKQIYNEYLKENHFVV